MSKNKAVYTRASVACGWAGAVMQKLLKKLSGDREKQGKGRKNQVVTTESTVRIFQTPKPVYTATCFTTMIDWKSKQVCTPPYIRDDTNEQIKQF